MARFEALARQVAVLVVGVDCHHGAGLGLAELAAGEHDVQPPAGEEAGVTVAQRFDRFVARVIPG